jgi:hypothetical protein
MKNFKKYLFAAVFGITLVTPVLQAQAFTIPGAPQPVIIISDIPNSILEGIKVGLASAFTRFASNYLANMLSKLEENYKIANYLYYSDALVSGQYLQDYMSKYVPNATDQKMLLAFIPQFSCGNNTDVTAKLKQLSRDYVGYDPATLDPSDPQYNQKLARLGNFLASPSGWQAHYQDLASQAESAAQQAAQNEINSPGLKAPRDNAGQIVASVTSLAQSEAASLISSLALGTQNPDSVVGQLASSLTYAFVNKFVFKGAVFREQATCLSSVQLQPVAPSTTTTTANNSSTEQTLFRANPSQVSAGGEVSLSWDVSSVANATQVVLNPGGKSVGTRGSENITINADTVFSLTLLDKNSNTLQVYTATVSTAK